MDETHSKTEHVGTIYLLLGLAQAAHSIEEMRTHLYDFFWVVTGLINQRVLSFPQFRMESDTFAVINMSLIALLLATVPAVRAGRPWALWLAGLAGVIETLNGIGHLSGAVYFGGYVPGAVSAPLLLLLGVALLRELAQAGALRI